MAVTFWETIRGTQLAETLIRQLPKIAKEKEQIVYTVSDSEVHVFLENHIESMGEKYVGHISAHGKTTIIMEKKE